MKRGLEQQRKKAGGRGVGNAALAIFFVVAVGFALVGFLVPVDSATTGGTSFAAASADHVLGTDNLGRDVLARVLHGGAQLLGIAALSTLVAAVVGITWGFAIAGRGAVAKVLMFAVDLFVVVPSMLLMMVLVFGMGPGVATMACVTTAVSAPFIARYTRSVALPALCSDYVEQARLVGDPAWKIAFREVLPNIALPLATDTGLLFIGAIYLVASAAFLGFDPLGSSSDWGTMVEVGLRGLSLNPWATIAPAVALASVTVSGNLLIDRIGNRGKL